ncbi:MAG TPA: hypothetical protein PL029_00715 [Bacteroidia bacterium]|nr:hypothetical protein [Bacteroidia bacterium]
MTGILFIARLGSTRLSNKHLIEVNGKSFIEWLISRYVFEFKDELEKELVKLIICSSVEPENKNFERVLSGQPIHFFYGNDENIPLRQLECAKEHGLVNIISIDGDDILCSSEAALNVYHQLLEKTNPVVKTSGLPLGMNVMGYSTEFLSSVVKDGSKYETGWGRIFDKAKTGELVMGNYSENTDLRFTLDYEADADFFKAIILVLKEKVISVSDKELIKVVLDQKFYELNKSVNNEYWENFNRQKENEINATPKKSENNNPIQQ